MERINGDSIRKITLGNADNAVTRCLQILMLNKYHKNIWGDIYIPTILIKLS